MMCTDFCLRPLRLAAPFALAALVVSAAAAAAQTLELTPRSAPAGWSVVPRLSFGGVWDDNVALVRPGEGRPQQDDYLTLLNPGVSVRHLARRTRLAGNYDGSFRFYREVSELNSYSQRAGASLRHQASPRTALSIGHAYRAVPTTDEAELAGVSFRRRGARTHSFGTGLDRALAARTSIGAGYDFLSVAFDEIDHPRAISGGTIHGANAHLTHQAGPRTSIGGTYAIRFAQVADIDRELTFQHGGLTFARRLARRVSTAGSVGVSTLHDSSSGETRIGPFVRAEVVHDWRHASAHAGYYRSFIPTFGLGGRSQTEEYRAGVRASFLQGRLQWQNGVAVRDTDPLDFELTRLRSVWLSSALGYTIARHLRAEAFYAFTYQDSRLPGGQVSRNRLGFHLVSSAPVRIR